MARETGIRVSVGLIRGGQETHLQVDFCNRDHQPQSQVSELPMREGPDPYPFHSEM